eukprot:TRINITY_DN962_c0_g2_i1.p1 TRINITY_DN962_c0_g2~~TRINITY_DN962_c0_g2_i1.p1  ORF type:complete len:319 (-),score=63.01 TRINITY_DN962_c0_g2_i1:89-1045(-)
MCIRDRYMGLQDMKSIKAFLILSIVVLCYTKPLVTKELIEELKQTATWEVTDYEDNVFKGIEDEDFSKDCPERKNPKGLRENSHVEQITDEVVEIPSNKKLDCTLPVKDQGGCFGATYAFAVAGMVSMRCCLKTGQKHGWLSPKEILSCDESDYGCAGGWPHYAARYVANGLVPEKCYPYNDADEGCPSECADKSNWAKAHICKCVNPIALRSVDDAKKALENGPIVASFEAYADLFSYKSGIYCHTAGPFKRVVSATVLRYSADPKPHIVIMLPFGENFGEKGLVRMCLDCCGLFGKYEKGNVACDITSQILSYNFD